MKLPHDRLAILHGAPGVHDEFSQKVKELDRRLQLNGLSYQVWDTLNDRQHDIFSHDLFLDGACAQDVKIYVDGALLVADSPDIQEELHHHSPHLMKAIDAERSHQEHRAQKGSVNGVIDSVYDTLVRDPSPQESEDS